MSSRTLFIGDVHGCAEEARAAIGAGATYPWILVGDMFRKGPDNMGVWTSDSRMESEGVIGNHDLGFFEKESSGYPKALLEMAQITCLSGLTENIRIQIARSSGEPCMLVSIHLNLRRRQLDEAVTLRRYPNDNNDKSPFWWEVHMIENAW